MKGKVKLKKFLRASEDRSFLLLCHHNADPDSLGSAIAFAIYLKSTGVERVKIGVAQSVSSYAKRLLSLSPVPVERNPPVEEDVVVIFDTSSLEQLEPIEVREGRTLVVIDHHVEKEKPIRADIRVVDSSRTSTAEIVWELLKYLGVYNETAVRALLAGIITDTANFRFANTKTFKAVSEMLEHFPIQLGEISQLVAPVSDENIDQAKKMAVLKACQRLEVKKFRKYIIAVSRVSAYEALACKVFLNLGADVAIVGSEKNGVRISARAREALVKRGLHLGRIMEGVGPVIQGSGGGHPGAAGANGQANLEEGVKTILKEIERFLKNMEG
ncbi:bifunctional oligoribonuclease/PAP phosphatase NrnA [Thermococcus sp.]|uniref:DHH family phosphoesterase n=1 Tax=Thermococcus sp. TaxID=35749 RepID=UPI0026202458|nr:bifunctional oligoribonuclease/PAP phosphatase NrnA [Thermococcus sp.]